MLTLERFPNTQERAGGKVHVLTHRSAFKTTKAFSTNKILFPTTKTIFLQKIKTWKDKGFSQALSILKFTGKNK